MDRNVTMVLRAFESRRFSGFYAEDRQHARTIVSGLVREDAIVGIGDSTTVRQIGLVEALKARGTKVLDGFWRGIPRALNYKLVRESTLCDVFLTGTNAITLDGRLLNVDAVGNRVAGIVHGHQTVIVVAGRNKLVQDIDKGFRRIRNIIAPNHIKIRSMELGGQKVQTPCVFTGVCSDCRSEDRRCNIFTIVEGKPLRTDINVVIIDEDLGLAWDASWPKERISRIIKEYKRYVWVPLLDQSLGEQSA